MAQHWFRVVILGSGGKVGMNYKEAAKLVRKKLKDIEAGEAVYINRDGDSESFRVYVCYLSGAKEEVKSG
jgi:hypothetical protein